MRSVYKEIFIVGDDEVSLQKFCNSIRFSTHCNYTIVSSNEPIDTGLYEHFTWFKKEAHHSDITHDADGVFYVTNNQVRTIDLSKNSEPIEFLLFDKHRSSESFGDVIKLIETNLDSNDIINELKSVCEFSRLTLEFLIDFEGQYRFICGLGESSDNATSVTVLDPELVRELESLKPIFSSTSDKKNILVSIQIENNSNADPKIFLDKLYSHWEVYRAFGINVPLLMVQNLLKRKVNTYHFTDSRDVRISSNNSTARYTFNYDAVYFDLDETLVWNDKAIEEVIAFMHRQIEHGKTPKLITRHTHDVASTLNKIGLSTSDFDQVIVVKPGEFKSCFILERSIFIDNEFPQRMDVRKNCGIPVLDLDQIDFI